MKPIEERTDLSFMQALRCVEYRVPRNHRLKRSGLILALGLRYGLIASAASHHLLLTADADEEADLLPLLGTWPRMVEDHMRWEVLHRLPFEPASSLPTLVAKLSQKPLNACVGLLRRLCPLEEALRSATDEFVAMHGSGIKEGWGWFRRGTGLAEFRRVSEESRLFAMHFFERRSAGLEELPEIALIGE